ncbi:MAG: protein BatD [Saprospiraceae bacterium]|nr:protein BatD [Saprospiraceae bacterium]
MRKGFQWFLFIQFLPVILLGQQVRFSASIDAKQVIVGSTFSISFNLENSDGENFTPPDFSPFKVVNGPSQSYQSTYINGVGTRSVGFSYTLQATRVGKFTIRGASIDAKGKKMQSNAVSVEVLKGEDLTQSGATPQIFIRAEIDSNQIFIGQQLMIRYKIYTQVNIENYNILTESNYAGCFAQALDTYKEPVLKEVISGKEYSTKVLRKVAIFPQQGGKIEIDPMVVQVGIPSKSSVRRGLLSSFGLERKNISSNNLTLMVKSAYDNAPTGFSGAVGSFQVRFRVNPHQATTDDAISLVLDIRGNGDIKTIRSPELKLPEGFELFEPKVKEEKMINATDSVRGEKTIEYLVIGHKPGRYTFRPSFTYFDPTKGQYKTLVDSFPLTITQGTGVLSSSADNTLPQQNEGIQPIEHNLSLHKIRRPIYLRPWYVAGYVVPILAFIFFSWRARQVEEIDEEVDPHAVAKERLQRAERYMTDGSFKSFYEEIALSLKQFIAFRLNLEASELSRQKIKSSLLQNGVPPDIEERTQHLIEKCDLALYGGYQNADEISSTYSEAVELITILNTIL